MTCVQYFGWCDFCILNTMQLGMFIQKIIILILLNDFAKLVHKLFISNVLLQELCLRVGWHFGVTELVKILNIDKQQYSTKYLFNHKKGTCQMSYGTSGNSASFINTFQSKIILFVYVHVLNMCVCSQLGLERYHGVGILGFNSAEWFIADIGAILAG